MTDNIETMRGVIADALSNPAGTCANSCEGNAYQIEIRRLICRDSHPLQGLRGSVPVHGVETRI